MTDCADLADYEWLTGEAACGLLNELAGDDAPLHTALARLRRHVSPERAHLILEQLELRRRAGAKFAHPERMFFTRLGLEQATDEWVAAHKAARFTSQRAAGFTPADLADLCCGIGGDLLALASHGFTLGIDRDPVAAHFAAMNTGAKTRATNVEDLDLAGFSAWHIDPDRRPAARHASPVGRRTTTLECCHPNLSAIEKLLSQNPHAAVKLAPATRVPADWAARCELEWISRDRQCRQLVAWHGHLAHAPGQHRATVLQSNPPPRSGERIGEGPWCVRTLVGSSHEPIPAADHVDDYLFDLDPAVLAAGLQGALAAEHCLQGLSTGPTYLTGPNPIDDAALACFEVTDVLPLELRKLAALLRARGVGRLEIKKRGVDIDPEKLRRDLKLRGAGAATLLITPLATRPTAILARRCAGRE